MTMKIGFIGPGIMGRPMVLNLRKAGFPVAVYARRAETLKPLIDAGATACASPKEASANSDVIVTIVSDTPDVEQVVFGDNGIAHGAKKGAVVVDMSTISPVATRRFAAELGKRGIDMLDAPVSGGEAGAIAGTLSIMVGGKADVFVRVKPVFEAMGKNIVLVGDNGAGQVAKACNQLVVAANIEAVAEAILFARKSGVDAGKVREALLGGFASSKVLEVHGNRMLTGDFKPGFKAKLHQKDMRIVMEDAGKLGIALPAAAFTAQQMNAAVGAGDGEMDSSIIYKALERMCTK
ncbi:MAG TPA: 2-hydroxy-3-oxopropionate reductase [Burkholderiales bacterium]|nr:2-hydroxy-3-oxopropionate reductase [Burkholderiales bacterium]